MTDRFSRTNRAIVMSTVQTNYLMNCPGLQVRQPVNHISGTAPSWCDAATRVLGNGGGAVGGWDNGKCRIACVYVRWRTWLGSSYVRCARSLGLAHVILLGNPGQ